MIVFVHNRFISARSIVPCCFEIVDSLIESSGFFGCLKQDVQLEIEILDITTCQIRGTKHKVRCPVCFFTDNHFRVKLLAMSIIPPDPNSTIGLFHDFIRHRSVRNAVFLMTKCIFVGIEDKAYVDTFLHCFKEPFHCSAFGKIKHRY